MQLFFIPEIEDTELVPLPEEEARHALQSLRKSEGDPVFLVDGTGGWYEGALVVENKKQACVRILKKRKEEDRKAPFYLAIAPTKNISRLEWCLEKCTEIGLAAVYPVISVHSERRNLRADRLERLLVSAMKQSLKAWLPQLHALQDLESFLRALPAPIEQRYIAFISPKVTTHLFDRIQAGSPVCVLIGPEGGFSPEEADLAQSFGFIPVSLGESRLRTETAAIAACTAAQIKNFVTH